MNWIIVTKGCNLIGDYCYSPEPLLKRYKYRNFVHWVEKATVESWYLVDKGYENIKCYNKINS